MVEKYCHKDILFQSLKFIHCSTLTSCDNFPRKTFLNGKKKKKLFKKVVSKLLFPDGEKKKKHYIAYFISGLKALS